MSLYYHNQYPEGAIPTSISDGMVVTNQGIRKKYFHGIWFDNGKPTFRIWPPNLRNLTRLESVRWKILLQTQKHELRWAEMRSKVIKLKTVYAECNGGWGRACKQPCYHKWVVEPSSYSSEEYSVHCDYHICHDDNEAKNIVFGNAFAKLNDRFRDYYRWLSIIDNLLEVEILGRLPKPKIFGEQFKVVINDRDYYFDNKNHVQCWAPSFWPSPRTRTLNITMKSCLHQEMRNYDDTA